MDINKKTLVFLVLFIILANLISSYIRHFEKDIIKFENSTREDLGPIYLVVDSTKHKISRLSKGGKSRFKISKYTDLKPYKIDIYYGKEAILRVRPQDFPRGINLKIKFLDIKANRPVYEIKDYRN